MIGYELQSISKKVHITFIHDGDMTLPAEIRILGFRKFVGELYQIPVGATKFDDICIL